MIGRDDDEMCLYNAKYIYPPKLHMTHDETEKWISLQVLNYHKNNISNEYMIDRIIYWRLSQVTCNLIKADYEKFEKIIPQLKQFWDYVLFYRENQDKLDIIVKYIKQVGEKNSADIFKKIHHYFEKENKTKYTPLYQQETEWRKKYNEKEARYKNYNNYRKNLTNK